MSLIIKKLHDAKKQRPVTIDDVDKDGFESVEDLQYRGNNYRVYRYKPNKKLVEGDYIKSKILYKGSINDAPITIFTNDVGQLTVKQDSLVDELYKVWGQGQYRVYKFGGTPRVENFFKNRFITKKDSKKTRE